MDNVAEVQKAIADMGYYAYSNAEWVEQMQGQYAMVQAVLGGIGAVSLFVAAIGIANTMMMSIYERTKEIGIMKVLGCSLGRIRDLFLMEAGFIGLSGGAIGLLLSYGISAIINVLVADSGYSSLSYIPLWLAGTALIFAVLIGMLAGLLPALRAMKLSALSALRNE
jgi:ABC-type antimicrobial peptide transport system permease subunit